ncbi:phosphotransferase enzyme [Salmonella enterica subsp. enterica]|uniref:Phosphotransferase enzyme n=1 Tax=Salmonella enterica I TaxID=59201 RepID=A0A447U2Y3_SALET|nr:phosphotransferase enzyme [Salmonella enterica subsp. enterica]
MFDYILSLGGTVFVPIIMIIIGLIFRIPWLQAVKAGVTVGIGFVGMGAGDRHGDRQSQSAD